MEPQCLGASSQHPECAANRYKAKIAELELDLSTLRELARAWLNAKSPRQFAVAEEALRAALGEE